ncbi:hypothetical protein MMC28_005623 [Mycoblastus sanguinarius]|nr:hypothetical protein [Mycoblastus sanguinarius]
MIDIKDILEPGIPTLPDWTPPDPVPIRMEVDVWWTSKEQIHAYQRQLFIEALLYFQEMPVTDPMSYFQIAGRSSSDCPSSLGLNGNQEFMGSRGYLGVKTQLLKHLIKVTVLTEASFSHLASALSASKALTDIMVDVIIPRYPDMGGLTEQLRLLQRNGDYPTGIGPSSGSTPTPRRTRKHIGYRTL